MDAKAALARMRRLAIGLAGRFSPAFGPSDLSGSPLERGERLGWGHRLCSDGFYWERLGEEVAGAAARRGDFGPLEAMLASGIPMLGMHVRAGEDTIGRALDAVAAGAAPSRLAERIAGGMIPELPGRQNALRPTQAFAALCLCGDPERALEASADARANLDLAGRDLAEEARRRAGWAARSAGGWHPGQSGGPRAGEVGEALARGGEGAATALGRLLDRAERELGGAAGAFWGRTLDEIGALGLLGRGSLEWARELDRRGGSAAGRARELADYGGLGLHLEGMGREQAERLLERLGEEGERELMERLGDGRAEGVREAWRERSARREREALAGSAEEAGPREARGRRRGL